MLFLFIIDMKIEISGFLCLNVKITELDKSILRYTLRIKENCLIFQTFISIQKI